MTNSIDEIADADAFSSSAPTPLSSHPLIGHPHLPAKQKGAKLIVADPRRIQMGMLADLVSTTWNRCGADQWHHARHH